MVKMECVLHSYLFFYYDSSKELNGLCEVEQAVKMGILTLILDEEGNTSPTLTALVIHALNKRAWCSPSVPRAWLRDGGGLRGRCCMRSLSSGGERVLLWRAETQTQEGRTLAGPVGKDWP